ncbi:outer membrane protein [Oligoflexus tunisiensis]|uniref:outer membrane protein n=1 Tax=Oligoflexus tunisiensis TaxID=708132 RepID=UPI00114D2C77|nr:outer membrane beta-barrel protein [Oligoflexus tunisiensis]
MKLANISVSALALLFAASGYSADLTVQGEVIGSQSKLDFGKAKIQEPVTGISITDDNDEKPDTLTAPGFGVSLQYEVNEALRLGGGLGYADYDGDDDEMKYSDMSVAANASYDFYKQDGFALYGLGGLSYHMVDPEDQKAGGLELKRESADLLNYDLGLGGRFDVAENVNLSLGYRFSDTLSKGTIDSKLAAVGSDASLKGQLKDVTLQKNEFIASVGYSF